MSAVLMSTKPFVARPSRVAASKSAPRRSLLIAFSAPDKGQVEAAIKEAQDACSGGDSGEW